MCVHHVLMYYQWYEVHMNRSLLNVVITQSNNCQKYIAGADFGRETGGTCPHPPLFSPRKNLHTSKKYSINKIYQINPRLKEMSCLMTIAETKKTFSAF